MGRAIAYSLLDLHQINPWTRLPSTCFGSVAGVRQSLLQRVNAARTKRMYVQKKYFVLTDSLLSSFFRSNNTPDANPGIPVENKAVSSEFVAMTTVPQSVFPQPSLTHKKRLLAISRSGIISRTKPSIGKGSLYFAESTQQRSSTVQGSSHLQGNVAATHSKGSLKRSRRPSPFTVQAVKVLYGPIVLINRSHS